MKNQSLSTRASKLIFFVMVFCFAAEDLHAQYFFFGKNRIQYEHFDWKYIQSEHFDIHYYGSLNYELANFTAKALESGLQQLSSDLNHQIVDRIKVIIYDSHNDFSQTNAVPGLPIDTEGIGGATDKYKNRITMPFTGDYAEFRSTLQHELLHAVFNDLFYGGNVQSIISNNIQLVFPLWFEEGLGEYLSLGWDTNTDMWIRDAVINNYLPDLQNLYGYFAYRGGQSMWNFIVEEYGREKIGEIIQVIKTQRNVEAGFNRALGLNISELSSRWKDFYRKRYLPEVAEREDINNIATLVTQRRKSGTYNTSPSLSPQGDKIAMITNARGFFDVVVISAVTGEKLKTLVKGQDNVNFEDLNILNPNLSWAADGRRLTLSTKSGGSIDLAIVDYNTGNVQKIKFPKLDAIGSVAWSPDGQKIAFDGNIGPYQDIFVYNLETREVLNLTDDAIPDMEPAWGADSQTVYFVSGRGDKVELGKHKRNTDLFLTNDLYSTDIYAVKIGADRAVRITKTPQWSEKQPATTRDGKLLYISDQNGIPNLYVMDMDTRVASPLTDLQSGVMQISVSADGQRVALNSINRGYLDIYLINGPLLRAKEGSLKPNQWAQRRTRESQEERVPATAFVKQMLTAQTGMGGMKVQNVPLPQTSEKPDTVQSAQQDTTAQQEQKKTGEIDFRNYVFAEEVTGDTAFAEEYLREDRRFEPQNNRTEDGRYQPKDYRLKFTTDIAYAGGSFSTSFGSYGLTQLIFSDLLGDHQIAFGTNLVFDLRNSDYFLQYGYFKNRTNYVFNFFHSSQAFQSFAGELLRFRYYGGGVNASYPLDKFRRLDFGLSVISISQDYSILGSSIVDNQNSTFSYPQVVFTSDRTLPGFITPRAGVRYSLSLTGSPPVSSGSLQFASALGDFRKYFNLGQGYTFALRGSGAASFGRDSQTFFMGGMLGWINRRWSGNSIPTDRLEDTFFTLPALPLRGHEYNSIYGDRFSLVNAEFRFPLFAAVLPGPIPIIPLYNVTGVAFLDAGAAWGEDILFSVNFSDGSAHTYAENESKLDFKVQEQGTRFLELTSEGNVVFENGEPVVVDQRVPGRNYAELPFSNGDVLIGAGFGLRTILFGLPFRYDIGWPYRRDGFDTKPIHYFSIGIDF